MQYVTKIDEISLCRGKSMLVVSDDDDIIQKITRGGRKYNGKPTLRAYKEHKHRCPTDIFYKNHKHLRFTKDSDRELKESNFYEVFCEVQQSNIHEVFTF